MNNERETTGPAEDITREDQAQGPGPAASQPEERFELEAPGGTGPEPAGDGLPPRRPGLLARIFGRRASLDRTAAGYEELMGVMHAIRGHIEQQTRSQSRLLEALDQMPEVVSSLKDIGRLGEHQEKTLALVREQAERSVEQGREVAGSIDRFDRTLHQVSDTNRDTAETMTGIADRFRESEEAMREMLAQANRRIALLLGVIGGVALVILAIAVYLVLGRGDADGAGASAAAGIAQETQEETSSQDPIPAFEPKPTDVGIPAVDLEPADESGDLLAAPHETQTPDVLFSAPAVPDEVSAPIAAGPAGPTDAENADASAAATGIEGGDGDEADGPTPVFRDGYFVPGQ